MKLTSIAILITLLGMTANANENRSKEYQFISEMAEMAGVYFDYEDTEYKDNVLPVLFDKLPGHIQTFIKRKVVLRAEQIQNEYHQTDAEISDIHQIILNNRVIGYVIKICDYIDHPMWDGSGIYLFMEKKSMKEVVSIEWQG